MITVIIHGHIDCQNCWRWNADQIRSLLEALEALEVLRRRRAILGLLGIFGWLLGVLGWLGILGWHRRLGILGWRCRLGTLDWHCRRRPWWCTWWCPNRRQRHRHLCESLGHKAVWVIDLIVGQRDDVTDAEHLWLLERNPKLQVLFVNDVPDPNLVLVSGKRSIWLHVQALELRERGENEPPRWILDDNVEGGREAMQRQVRQQILQHFKTVSHESDSRD